MKKVNIHEAKTQLSKILAEVETTGESALICRNGIPVAQLSRIPKYPGIHTFWYPCLPHHGPT